MYFTQFKSIEVREIFDQRTNEDRRLFSRSIFDVTSNDCIFRATPLTFDPSLVDIFLALHCGASLCIVPDEIRRNPIAVASLFNQSRCTIAQVRRLPLSFRSIWLWNFQMTPSFFRQIEKHCDFSSLKTLVLGGEPFPSLSNPTIEQMVRTGKRLINIYGLTEMSCWASYHIFKENDLQ